MFTKERPSSLLAFRDSREHAAPIHRARGMVLVAILMTVGALPAASSGASKNQTNRLIHNGLIVFGRDAPSGLAVNIYAISSRGGAARLLIGGNVVDGSASWSPDGSKLAFDRYRGGPGPPGVEKVVVANVDGSKVREIADGNQPVWSPAGDEIAFDGRASGNVSRIFVIHPDGSGKRLLTPPRLVAFGPAWSPNGRQLAFYGGRNSLARGVYVVGENGRGEHRLAPVRRPDIITTLSPPAWSPHGNLIGYAGGNDRYTKLYLASADGRKTRTLLARPSASLGEISVIAWSRDGRTIAFDGAIGRHNAPPFAVYVVRSSGLGMKRVERFADHPVWSPDGRELLFSTYSSSYALEIVNSRGRLLRRIDKSTANDHDPAWQPLP
jgi:Tol biopolymer transport system component